MNKKTRVVFALSCFSILAVASVAAVGVGAAAGGRLFANDGATWKHYKQALPGTVNGSENGVREYWVSCGGEGYQFTAPAGATIQEATTYDFSGFEANDPRYIIPLKGEYRSAFLVGGNRYHSETPELAGAGWWYSGTLPELGKSKTMIWKNVNDSDTNPYYYVDTMVVTKVINNWTEFKATFQHSGAYTADEKVEGYYVLGSDITINQNINNENYTSALYNAGFVGEFDGRGHSMDATSVPGAYNGGLFGLVNGATIKNVSITSSCPSYAAGLVTGQANDSIFKNIKVTIPTVGTDNASYGRFVARFSANNLFEDIDISFGAGQTVSNIFGGNTNAANDTFINVTVQNDTKPTMWYTVDGGGTKITNTAGLVYIPNGYTIASGRRDIVAKTAAQAITMPAEVTGDITAMKLVDRAGTEYDLGADPTAIALPEAFVTNAEQHGENVLLVTTSTGNYAVKVTVVTSYISTAADMALIRGCNLGKKVYGYFAMTNDVVVDYSATGIGQTTNVSGWSTTANGFYGVFDGRGHVIKGNAYTASKGIFGTIQGAAVIMNMNIYNDNYTGYDTPLIGVGIMGVGGATGYIRFANVDINVKAVGSNTARTGILSASGLNTVAFQNYTVTIRGEYPEGATVSLMPANYLTEATRFNHFVWNTPHATTLSVIAGKTSGTVNPGMTINYTDVAA
ncbi:MAG: hypothetical protein MJ239_02195 [Bacilli bacterium]|nr:hypothetical protein [Bacilli bacterium]